MAKKNAKIKITLEGSPYGRKPKQCKTLQALGLHKIGASREHNDSEMIRGMVRHVMHLVRVDAA